MANAPAGNSETAELFDAIIAATQTAYAEGEWAVALRLLRAAQLAVIGAAQASGLGGTQVGGLRLIAGGKSGERN